MIKGITFKEWLSKNLIGELKVIMIKGITFKEWLSKNLKDDSTTEIYVTGENLIDLNGIENFKNLKYLRCFNNKLTELPDLSNLSNLEKLSCHDNKLTELPDLSNLNNLKFLDCYDNKLPYNNLSEYLEWHKKNFPWIWDAKKYNLF